MLSDQLAALRAETERLNAISDERWDTYVKSVKWGSYGKSGNGPLKWRVINGLDTDHLENIIVAMSHISRDMRKAMLWLLKKRYLSELS